MQEFNPSRIHDYRAEQKTAERHAKSVTLETARAAFVAKRESLAAMLTRLQHSPRLKTREDHARINDLIEAIALLDEEGLNPRTGLIDELVAFFESAEVVAARKLLRSPSISNIEVELSRLRESA